MEVGRIVFGPNDEAKIDICQTVSDKQMPILAQSWLREAFLGPCLEPESDRLVPCLDLAEMTRRNAVVANKLKGV